MPGHDEVGLLALLVVGPVLYLAFSIGYRRLLFGMLPDPEEISTEVEQPAGPGERHCPRCGTINDDDFARCYECGARLPPDPDDLAADEDPGSPGDAAERTDDERTDAERTADTHRPPRDREE